MAFLTSGPEATGAETVRQLARAVYDYIVPSAVTGFGQSDPSRVTPPLGTLAPAESGNRPVAGAR